MTDRPMMACGHTANAVRETPEGEVRVCAICFGKPEAEQIVDAPLTEGRLMRCSYARDGQAEHTGGGQYAGVRYPSTRASDPQRGAFFKSQPDQSEDSFYCGCWGWD